MDTRIQPINTRKPIVLVFGKLCSGKGTYCKNYIMHGYHHITVSDIVRKVSGKVKRSELQNTADMDQAIADELIKEIYKHKKVVIDGIRQTSIVQRLLDYFGEVDIHMVWLDVPDDVRRKRFSQRGADKDDRSFDDAEQGDIKLGIDQVGSTFHDKLQYVDYS